MRNEETRTRDAIALEYRAVLKEMNGISPKLAIYGELKLKAEGLYKRLGSMAPEIKKMKPKNYTLSNLKPKPRRGCAFPGCSNLGMLHSKGRYRPWCNRHRSASRR